MGLFKRILKLLFGSADTGKGVRPGDSGAPSDTSNRDYSVPGQTPQTQTPASDQGNGTWFDTNPGTSDVGVFQSDTGVLRPTGPVQVTHVDGSQSIDPTESQPASEPGPSEQVQQPAASENADNSGTADGSASGPSLSGLDTDRFAPLSNEEALAQTRTADWRSAYYDSMAIIPPADLPRIQVIDRTMVGMGLISSEELAEIHEINRQMSFFRSDHQQIEAAGYAAVRRSREERQRIKQLKKEEAARRKQEYQKGVAERRATDIIFIGRGISKGLADRKSNVELLQFHQIPVVATPSELATAMELTIPELRWLAFHAESATRTHYVTFSIPKKSGGTRKISSPHRKLATAQRWILENILVGIPPHDAAHGFVAGRSVVSNAIKHVGQDILVNVDLKSFFPTIHFYRVDGLFRSLGYSPAVSAILASICTESPRETVRFAGETYHVATGKPALPQGACTSPAISNLVTRHFDHRIASLSEKLGWNYTRYADDLSFSASQGDEHEKEKQIGYLLARIRHISRDEGFEVNEKKTRILRNHTRQVVTGVTVNDRVNVSRKSYRQLRAILHRAKFEGLESQNRNNHPSFRNWVEGMIAWIEMVNPDRGQRLRGMYAQVK